MRRTLPSRYRYCEGSIEMRTKNAKRAEIALAENDRNHPSSGIFFFKVSDARRSFVFAKSVAENEKIALSFLAKKSPWVERENKEIMPDGPRLPLKRNSLPRHWILHQRNADVFALLRALFSLSHFLRATYSLFISIQPIISSASLLLPFPSPKPESDSFPLALFTLAARSRRSISTFRYPLASPDVAHLSLVNVAVTRKGRS